MKHSADWPAEDHTSLGTMSKRHLGMNEEPWVWVAISYRRVERLQTLIDLLISRKSLPLCAQNNRVLRTRNIRNIYNLFTFLSDFRPS